MKKREKGYIIIYKLTNCIIALLERGRNMDNSIDVNNNNNILCDIDFFMEYLKNVKNASENTLQSYKRDLTTMAKYFQGQGIESVGRINSTNINSYILYMERQGKSASTISRNMSAIKTFFRCMINNGKVMREPTENIHTPELESKRTEAISSEDMMKILAKIGESDSKAIRDRAMYCLMLDTGIKVSEVIGIKLNDVNLKYSYVTCHGSKKDKTIRFEKNTLLVLERYIKTARDSFVKSQASEELFLNCFGKKMSRQGFWKNFKEYANLAGLKNISARALHKNS